MSAEGPTRAAECDPGPKLPTAAGGVRWAEAAPRTRHGRLPVGKPALLSTPSHSAADSTESELNTAVYNRPIVKLLHSVPGTPSRKHESTEWPAHSGADGQSLSGTRMRLKLAARSNTQRTNYPSVWGMERCGILSMLK